eukprot:1139613-Pelagomonas_calceolata.AAC.1
MDRLHMRKALKRLTVPTLQGLNQQADGYSIDEFIQGSKRAVHEVFPGVRHASFCLLDRCAHVNASAS